MEQPLPIREALRIFRLTVIVKLAFLGLSGLALLGLVGLARMGPLLRAAPTLLLAVLFLPSWLERVLGRYFLALGLGLDVLFSSLEMAVFFFSGWTLPRLANLGVPAEVVYQLTATPSVEPFLFLLIPLVLLAWGYGRRGAVLGSTWAVILHLGTGLWALERDVWDQAFVQGTMMRVALLYLVPLIVSILAQRERQQHAQLEAAHQRLRRHAATVERLATSRERNRLARELHDTLAHSLSALAVQLEALRTLLVNDPAAAQRAVDETAELARHGLEESRQAIQALRADPLETWGLAGALQDLIQAFQERTGVEVHLVIAGDEPDLTSEEAQTLFRIAEEALTNVERHAAAQSVFVRLARGTDRLDLVIRDDGYGFEPTDVHPDHYGLTGMRERAAIIGATLEVNSHPGGGTEIWCLLQRE